MDAGLAQVQSWSVELEGLCERIAPRFCRVEVRRRAGAFLRGLLAGVERKNAPARRRTSTRWNRGAIRSHSPSSSAAHPSTCATPACTRSPHSSSSNNRSKQVIPEKCGCSIRGHSGTACRTA